MASLVVPRSLLLSPVAGLLLVTIAISFTAVADCASAPGPAPPTAVKKPIEVYPGCSKTKLPERCSVELSKLAKRLVEMKAIITGPQLAAQKLKTDPCITGCAKIVDETASKAIAAKADKEALEAVKMYLDDTDINQDGPIGPCVCNCPEPCTADEAAGVKKLGEAMESVWDVRNKLGSLFHSGADNDSESEWPIS